MWPCQVLSRMVPLLAVALVVVGVGADSATYPNLPLGDINVLVLTDTHSWLGGHGEKEDYDLNYGDVLSFYQILHEEIRALENSDPDKHKHDLFFVMNGDWIDGTGLAMNGNPSYLIPLLQRMPWDAVNVGNHELYKRSVVEYILRPAGFAEWWGSRYLSSNIVKTANKEPMGNRFHIMAGRHSTVLVFGFLYNMQENDPIVTVERVQDTINEGWFEEVLGFEIYDAILVLAHMDHKDSLVQVILNRIRGLVDEDMPVQFITGHTHYRGLSSPDNCSSSFEAGRYLDTVGFVSFPTQDTIREAAAARQKAAEEAAAARQKAAEEAAAARQKAAAEAANSTAPADNSTDLDSNCQDNSTNCSETNNTTSPNCSENSTDCSNPNSTRSLMEDAVLNISHVEYKDAFQHVFIDAKYSALQSVLGMDDVVTSDGIELAVYIAEVQEDLGLFEIVGCVRDNYYLEKGLDQQDSLWGFFCHHVIPHVFPWKTDAAVHNGNPKVAMMDKGSWRYDLFARELILDEVFAVSPFNDTLFMFPGIPGSVITQLNSDLNINGPGKWMVELPEWVMCPSPASDLPQPDEIDGTNTLYDLVAAEFSVDQIREALEVIWKNASTAEADVPAAVPIAHHTTTSVWLQFFDKTDLCRTENKGNKRTKKNDHHSSGTTSSTSSKPKSGDLFNTDSEEWDNDRVIFVVVGVCIVVVLTGIYVRKRSRIFRSEVDARELATLEALEEYNEREDARYSDGVSDNDVSHELL